MAPDDKTALLIIDAQQEYFAPAGKMVLPGGPPAVKQISRVLAWARGRRLPVFHIVHESRRPGATIFVPGSPALEIHPEVKPAPSPGPPWSRASASGGSSGSSSRAS